ncbi:MAG: F0F1 ATP synthase subunit gamma [Planctomycetaceae bacterium]|nr:F0F1 ATP synthase subunit gamma [Planctomycetaceae bacterium]
MQTLESLKRQIDNVEDLSSVVKTMKTLAAVSIRQYEQAVESLADYFSTVECGLQILLREQPVTSSVELTSAHRVGAIVFGSDQGMCGNFNEQVATFAASHLCEELKLKQADCSLLVVGSRASSHLADAGFTIDEEIAVASSASGITDVVQKLLAAIAPWRVEKRIGRILLYWNRRQAVSSYTGHWQELLPVRPEQFRLPHNQKWPGKSLPLHTMDREILFTRLIQQYLFVSLFQAHAESLAGENASRIASMHAAERNVQTRLDELRSEYHQKRQTVITEELLDVVTGVEALMRGDADDEVA